MNKIHPNRSTYLVVLLSLAISCCGSVGSIDDSTKKLAKSAKKMETNLDTLSQSSKQIADSLTMQLQTLTTELQNVRTEFEKISGSVSEFQVIFEKLTENSFPKENADTESIQEFEQTFDHLEQYFDSEGKNNVQN